MCVMCGPLKFFVMWRGAEHQSGEGGYRNKSLCTVQHRTAAIVPTSGYMDLSSVGAPTTIAQTRTSKTRKIGSTAHDTVEKNRLLENKNNSPTIIAVPQWKQSNFRGTAEVVHECYSWHPDEDWARNNNHNYY